MLFRHSKSIEQQLIPIYNTTVHKNKSNVALNVDTSWCYGETPTLHKGGQESEDLFSDILDVIVEILVI